MKLLLPIVFVLLFVACKESTLPDDEVFGPSDSTCVNPNGEAWIDFKHINFNKIALRIKEKIDSTESLPGFSAEDFQNMRDSIQNAVFPFQQGLSKGDAMIDTTNLLTQEDSGFIHYTNNVWAPQPLRWSSLLYLDDFYIYQEGKGFQTGYEFLPCIQQTLGESRWYKRKRKGVKGLGMSDPSIPSIDKVEATDCVIRLEVVIQIDKEAPFFGRKNHHFYHVVLYDTATVYTPRIGYNSSNQ